MEVILLAAFLLALVCAMVAQSRVLRGAALLGAILVVVMTTTSSTPPSTIDLTIAQEAP